MLGEVIGDLRPLPVVPAADAEHVRAAFVGQLRARRARADHQNPCLLVDLRGRDRGVGAQMPGDEDGAIARQLACERHRLIGVAGVVADDQLDALAQDAALGVEVLDRHPGGALVLLAEPAHRAGHRAGDRDPDLGLGGRGAKGRSQRSGRAQTIVERPCSGPPPNAALLCASARPAATRKFRRAGPGHPPIYSLARLGSSGT